MGPGTRVNGTGSLPANHVGPDTSHREGYKMASAIQWFLWKFNVNAIDPIAAFKDAGAMCPVIVEACHPGCGY